METLHEKNLQTRGKSAGRKITISNIWKTDKQKNKILQILRLGNICLLYTSDAADE